MSSPETCCMICTIALMSFCFFWVKQEAFQDNEVKQEAVAPSGNAVFPSGKKTKSGKKATMAPPLPQVITSAFAEPYDTYPKSMSSVNLQRAFQEDDIHKYHVIPCTMDYAPNRYMYRQLGSVQFNPSIDVRGEPSYIKEPDAVYGIYRHTDKRGNYVNQRVCTNLQGTPKYFTGTTNA